MGKRDKALPRRFRSESAVTREGWTRWVQPNPECYWMKCCDCGLVHEMQFRVDGDRAQFRARRTAHSKPRHSSGRERGKK